jgi:hypothetical protein
MPLPRALRAAERAWSMPRRAGLAPADAFGLGGMEGIELPATLVLLGPDLGSTRHRRYWRLGAARLDLVAHAWLCIMCR